MELYFSFLLDFNYFYFNYFTAFIACSKANLFNVTMQQIFLASILIKYSSILNTDQ
jgi:hypothetical protein